jgi:hypothetical protein
MMHCFAFGTIEHLLIWMVVIFAVFAIARVLLSLAPPPRPELAWLMSGVLAIVRIILWAVVIIAVIFVLFSLLACVVPIF